MNAKPVIIVSVLLNVGLLGAIGYLVTRPPASSRPDTEQVVVQTNTLERLKTARQTITNTVVKTWDWRSMESADYKEYIANLRSIGCPEETIRDIIVADVNKLFESRKKAQSAGKKFEFWKSGNMFAGMVDEDAIKKKQELAQEKKALLKELLGIDINEPADLAAVANPLTSMLDFLPEDKQSKISEMMQSFQARAMKGFKGGSPDAEDLKEMMKVQKEFEGELAKVLTPQELEDYQLRLSQTSMMMRMQLGPFEPNEQEFRELFKLRKGFDDEFGWAGAAATTKEERDRKTQAEEALKDQIKGLLGEDRYKDYTRASDYNYQGLVKIAERNGLSREVAANVFDMDKLAKEQLGKLREDKTLTSERRAELVKEVKKETQNSIRQVLGEKAYESYTNRPNFQP